MSVTQFPEYIFYRIGI